MYLPQVGQRFWLLDVDLPDEDLTLVFVRTLVVFIVCLAGIIVHPFTIIHCGLNYLYIGHLQYY